MARKTNFTRDMSNFYRSGKRQGLSDRAIAEQMGISASTLSRIKTRKSEPSAKILNQFRAETTDSDEYFITYDELADFQANRIKNPRVAREADAYLKTLERKGLTMQEIRNSDLKRPTVWRTVRGKRIGVLLGRSKQDAQRESVRKQLIAQGVNPDETDDYYNEALQISEGK